MWVRLLSSPLIGGRHQDLWGGWDGRRRIGGSLVWPRAGAFRRPHLSNPGVSCVLASVQLSTNRQVTPNTDTARWAFSPRRLGLPGARSDGDVLIAAAALGARALGEDIDRRAGVGIRVGAGAGSDLHPVGSPRVAVLASWRLAREERELDRLGYRGFPAFGRHIPKVYQIGRAPFSRAGGFMAVNGWWRI
jgi:hypothetical protein